VYKAMQDACATFSNKPAYSSKIVVVTR
jgi:hypothetical protein